MKTLFTRKSFILSLIVIILIIGATGYMVFGRSGNKNINQNISDTITEIEKSKYELNTLKITYDEYSQRTDKYLSKYFTSFYKSGSIIYADDTFASLITGKKYSEKDWKGISLDELKKIGEPLSQSLALSKPGYFYTSFDVSKVYDDNSSSDTSQHYKNIFIRMNDLFGVTHYKQYKFKREGQNYVLFTTSSVLVERNKELTYGNEKVEFIQNVILQ